MEAGISIMPKRKNNVWKKCITFSKLLLAHNRAKKGKRFREEVIRFEMNLEENLMTIGKELLLGTYKFGDFREFTIYEPKERKIKVLPYRDRIVHQLYVEECLKPIFVKDFISDSYACIKERGVQQAVNKLKKYMRRMKYKNDSYYILKCDIKKFFYNVDHDLLYEVLKRRIKDKDFLEFSKKIIYCNDERCGIPIGNYTSQYFANIYLNVLDKYVKERLKIECYVRYMDDFVILLKSKQECRDVKNKLKNFLKEMKLELNPKTNYFKNEQGVNFCGYKLYEDKTLLRGKNKTRLKRWFKKMQKMYANDTITIEEINRKIPSIRGHLLHCNSFRMYEKMIDKFILMKSN